MENVFSGLSLIIAIGAVVALLMRIIGQPLIIGYILTGVIVGPAVLHVAKSPDTLTLFSDLGIALLLFIIGLGLNPRVVREVGRTAIFVGVTQVGFVGILGLITGRVFGLSSNESLFLGASLAFSSTIIIIKLLGDKKEQARLYGKIAISVSLVQDIFAIALVVITSAGENQSLHLGSLLSLSFKAALIGWIIYTISYKVLPRFNTLIAGSQEFLFLFAIAWGLGSAALFAKIGLSSEIGALLAGICLAPLAYAQEIASRLRPLRDFFLIVFFISLGSNLSFHSVSRFLPLIVTSMIIAIIIKPLVAMGVMGYLGYTKRTSFKAGLALAQVSEFSIVLIILASAKGLVSSDVVSVLIFITLVSIAASTYLINYSDKLFGRFGNYLNIFERHKTHNDLVPEGHYELVLFGYQRGGHEFVNLFKQLKKKYIVIDYDPDVIDVLEHNKIVYLYGDATDAELLEEAGLERARLVVSTIPDYEVNVSILKFLEHKNPRAVAIMHADHPEDATKLYDLGASYIILPHYIGSEKVSSFISKSGLTKQAFKNERAKHLTYIKKHYSPIEKQADEEKQRLGQTIVKNMAALAKVKV